MLAGTFNLVMAERLARKVCYHCKQATSVKGTPQHRFAVSSFKNIIPELLKKEIISRNITQEQRNSFINEGMIMTGTGKDPET
ncbi:TPA: hypothetical protein DIC40_04020 [Patescibacteria group bacterium]|nr:hypothetical protein [Candidatus Gracilibacteria bacterium]